MGAENIPLKSDVLIVNGEKDISNMITSMLQERGYAVHISCNLDSAFVEMVHYMPRFILLNIQMVGYLGNSLAFLDKMKEIYPDILVLMISDQENIDMSISSIKRGAFDFIDKPIKINQFNRMIDKVMDNMRVHNPCDFEEIEEDLIGTSVPMSQLRQIIERVSPTNSRVMIFGLSGSEKELVARLIHKKSSRSKGSFVFFDATHMSSEVIETVLFGMEDSAGKVHRIGCLEKAYQGTIYINEVVDIPHDIQDKILSAIIQQKFKRVNGEKSIALDVRIISSTSVNPHNYIVKKLLREDLYYRLAVVPILVPSLVERKEDIPLLVEH